MAILGDLGVDVEVVEENEAARELAMVGRGLVPEQDELGIAVALARSPKTWS